MKYMKSRIILWSFFGILLFTSSFASAKSYKNQAQPISKRQELMLNDLGYIQNLFQTAYAPMEWKKENFGFDVEQEIAKVKARVLQKNTLSIKEFQEILKNLCNSIKDYHVVIKFYSTESANLPFRLQGAEGKYFISAIKNKNFPFSVGDEIISFNGEPIHLAIEAFKTTISSDNHFLTDQALAEMYFTIRSGEYADKISKGPVTLIIKEALSGKLITYETQWNYQEEKILDCMMQRAIKATFPGSFTNFLPSNNLWAFNDHLMTPHYERLADIRSGENEPSVALGAKKNMIPPLGEILWQAPEEMNFYAYLFALPNGKKGGYVRIPTYLLNGNKAAQEFAEIIQLLQAESEVLVIDQLNNPGGRTKLLYTLLSMLSNQPLKLPKDRYRLNQETIYVAFGDIDLFSDTKDDKDAQDRMGTLTMNGYPVDYIYIQGLLKFCTQLIDTWNQGKIFTDFFYQDGIETIRPSTIACYTKPILVLINSLDFSCGDLFPAILQDNQRATLMGSRTAGAGGSVEKFFFRNLNGIKSLSLTTSFTERSNGQPLENLGVTPDIPYEVSAIDLQNNYIEYRNRILEVLEPLQNL